MILVYVYTEGITSLVIMLETNQSAYMHVKLCVVICCIYSCCSNKGSSSVAIVQHSTSTDTYRYTNNKINMFGIFDFIIVATEEDLNSG